MSALPQHRAETIASVAEPTMCAPWRCSPCPGHSWGLSLSGTSVAVPEGHGLWVLWGLCAVSRKLRSGSALTAIISGVQSSLHPLTPSSESGCCVPVAHLLLAASPGLAPL